MQIQVNKRYTARKDHECDCCGRWINPGDPYHRLVSFEDGSAEHIKLCTRCEDYLTDAFTNYVVDYAGDMNELLENLLKAITVDNAEAMEEDRADALREERQLEKHYGGRN